MDMIEENSKKNKLIKEVKEIKKNIKLTPATEHVFNVITAVLASIPIGASFASLIKDYMPEAKFKRIDAFTKQIANDLKRLNDKIDSECIAKDEYAYMFEQSFRGVAQNYQEEKIEAFRAILLNSAIRQDVIQEEKEFFLSLVNSLSVVHIRILKFLSNPEDYIQEQRVEPSKFRGIFKKLIMPELDTSIIELAFNDLFQLGLIKSSKTTFYTMETTSGRQEGDRINDLGRRFIIFCKSP